MVYAFFLKFLAFTLIIALFCSTSLLAQELKPDKPWRTPGEFQKPGEIQVPKGPWRVPGEFQKPGEIQVVKAAPGACVERLLLASDTLFEYDKADLSPVAEVTLGQLASMLKSQNAKEIVIEGHTDSKGSDEYNQKLSYRRASAVEAWLMRQNYLTSKYSTLGKGEKEPIAPNDNQDGTDNPDGRAKNRRVEVVLNVCEQNK